MLKGIGAFLARSDAEVPNAEIKAENKTEDAEC